MWTEAFFWFYLCKKNDINALVTRYFSPLSIISSIIQVKSFFACKSIKEAGFSHSLESGRSRATRFIRHLRDSHSKIPVQCRTEIPPHGPIVAPLIYQRQGYVYEWQGSWGCHFIVDPSERTELASATRRSWKPSTVKTRVRHDLFCEIAKGKSRKMSPEKVSSTTSPNRKVSYQLCYFLWTQRIVHYNNKELFITFATFQSLKPVMERKRRARINASLAELKSLLIEVIKAEVSVAFIPRD